MHQKINRNLHLPILKNLREWQQLKEILITNHRMTPLKVLFLLYLIKILKELNMIRLKLYFKMQE